MKTFADGFGDYQLRSLVGGLEHLDGGGGVDLRGGQSDAKERGKRVEGLWPLCGFG